MAVAQEAPLVGLGQAAAGEADELARHHVGQHEAAVPRELVDARAGDDRPAEATYVLRQRVRERRGAAARDRPADGVAHHGQCEPEARARPPLERQHRMRAVAREPGARPLGLEQRLSHRARVAEGRPRRPRERARPHGTQRAQRSPGRRRHRAENRRRELLPGLDEWLDQPPVRRPVASELFSRLFHASLEQHGGPVVERVRGRRLRVDPLHVEPERVEERRARRERHHGGANVMDEARQRQLLRVQPAPGPVRRLAYLGLHPSLQERDCRREPVWPGADDERLHER